VELQHAFNIFDRTLLSFNRLQWISAGGPKLGPCPTIQNDLFPGPPQSRANELVQVKTQITILTATPMPKEIRAELQKYYTKMTALRKKVEIPEDAVYLRDIENFLKEGSVSSQVWQGREIIKEEVDGFIQDLSIGQVHADKVTHSFIEDKKKKAQPNAQIPTLRDVQIPIPYQIIDEFDCKKICFPKFAGMQLSGGKTVFQNNAMLVTFTLKCKIGDISFCDCVFSFETNSHCSVEVAERGDVCSLILKFK